MKTFSTSTHLLLQLHHSLSLSLSLATMQSFPWDFPWRWRENRVHVLVAISVLWFLFMVVTPRIPHSPNHHLFADMRNLLGVPNTLNVLTNFPFLIVGVIGLVFCLYGGCFGISTTGELWGWGFFYAGIIGLAFGSAYYHLKPDDARVIWDRLPMMISIASLFSILVIERIDGWRGITCLFSLVVLVLISIAYERAFDDLRFCMMVQFLPCLAIPAMILLFPPKYTHPRYWFLAAGFYLLAQFEAIYDKKVYRVNQYVISGHSLEHLCLAAVPTLLMLMLWFRNIRIERNS